MGVEVSSWRMRAICILALIFSKIPIAVLPLGIVLSSVSRGVSYSFGTFAYGLFIFGEIFGVFSYRILVKFFSKNLTIVLGNFITCLCFWSLNFLSWKNHLVLLLMFGGGFFSSNLSGYLRSALITLYPENLKSQVLAFESTGIQIIWALGPSFAVFLLTISSTIVLSTVALCFTLTLIFIALLQSQPQKHITESITFTKAGKLNSQLFPTLLGSACASATLGLLELLLPILLEYRHSKAAYSGILLTILSISGIATSLLYTKIQGVTKLSNRSFIPAIFTCASLYATAIFGIHAVWICVIILGFSDAILLIARSIRISELVEPQYLAEAYSLSYGFQGVSYLVISLYVTLFLKIANPVSCLFIGTTLLASTFFIQYILERINSQNLMHPL